MTTVSEYYKLEQELQLWKRSNSNYKRDYERVRQEVKLYKEKAEKYDELHEKILYCLDNMNLIEENKQLKQKLEKIDLKHFAMVFEVAARDLERVMSGDDKIQQQIPSIIKLCIGRAKELRVLDNG